MANFTIQEKRDFKLDEIMKKLNEEYFTIITIEKKRGLPICIR